MHFSSASPSSATLTPVSSHFSSNPSPVTILFMLSIICLRSSTSPTSLATSLHPWHANTQVPPRISAQELVHPELSKSTQLLQVPQTKLMSAGYTSSHRRSHVSFKRRRNVSLLLVENTPHGHKSFQVYLKAQCSARYVFSLILMIFQIISIRQSACLQMTVYYTEK